MYKKIKNSSFMNWLWFLVYLIPFLISLGYTLFISNGFKGVLTFADFDSQYISTYLNSLVKFLGGSVGQDGFIYRSFRDLLGYFFLSSISGNQIYEKIIPLIIQYFSLVTLLHLAFDFLMLLPNICHKFMEKVGGERD